MKDRNKKIKDFSKNDIRTLKDTKKAIESTKKPR